jgi:membrane associated rhomboid family serine protease
VVVATIAVYVALGLRDGTFAGTGASSRDLALFGPAVDDGELWRLVSHAIVHYGPIHLAFNMFILYQVGLWLETAAGSLRFIVLYVVSVLGGAAGALLLDPRAFTGGASGGVFGVAAAATLAMARRGIPFGQTAFGPLLAINLVLGFTLRNVSIGGHLGGLVAGLVAAEVMLQARRHGQAHLAIPLALLVGVACVALALR